MQFVRNTQFRHYFRNYTLINDVTCGKPVLLTKRVSNIWALFYHHANIYYENFAPAADWKQAWQHLIAAALASRLCMLETQVQIGNADAGICTADVPAACTDTQPRSDGVCEGTAIAPSAQKQVAA